MESLSEFEYWNLSLWRNDEVIRVICIIFPENVRRLFYSELILIGQKWKEVEKGNKNI